MDGYPERPSFWAMRVQKEFFDLGEHVRLGTPALALLFVVVGREDESRYRRPAYWQNEVLAAFLGWGEKTMRRVRQSLIDSGWLHYEPGKRGSPGVYWSLLPTQATGVTSDQETGTQPQTGVTSDQLSARKREGKPPGNGDQTTFLDPKPLPKPKRALFVPPTLDDVTAYCQERGNSIDPEAWLAYYESNGWRVGRNPMKSWKMAVVTWEKRNKEFGNGNGRKVGYDDDPRGNKQTVVNYMEKLCDEDD